MKRASNNCPGRDHTSFPFHNHEEGHATWIQGRLKWTVERIQAEEILLA
jgi:hypothetical protein